MNNYEMKICRLCFNLIIGEYDPIEGSLKMMLGIITPDLNFEMTSDPVMCKECSDCAQKAFDFKTNFFEVEEIIESKKTEHKDDCPNLSVLLSGRHKSLKMNYCRTCLHKIKEQLFLDANMINNGINILPILQNCLFEMDFSLTSDCKICLPCFNKLQEMYKFKTHCMRNEQTLNSYLKEITLESNSKINLHNVVSVTIKQEIDIHNIKVEAEDETFQNIVQNYDWMTSIKEEDSNEAKEEILQSTTNEKQLQELEELIYKNATSVKGKQQFNCPHCSFNTKYKNNMKRHLINIHRRPGVIKTRFYECKECTFSTRKQVDMIKHLLTHANADLFTCSKCSYANHQKTELIKHIFSHIDKNTLQKYKAATEEGVNIRKNKEKIQKKLKI